MEHTVSDPNIQEEGHNGLKSIDVEGMRKMKIRDAETEGRKIGDGGKLHRSSRSSVNAAGPGK